MDSSSDQDNKNVLRGHVQLVSRESAVLKAEICSLLYTIEKTCEHGLTYKYIYLYNIIKLKKIRGICQAFTNSR